WILGLELGVLLHLQLLPPLTCSSTSFLTLQLTPIILYWMRWRSDLRILTNRAITTFKTRVRRMENVVSIVTTIGGVRRKLMNLRRSLTPTRDMLGMVMRGAVPFVADSNLRSFRDVYDHSFQLLETIDNDRDRTSDVRDLYISLHSASTDNTIKLLTAVATMFLPLSLLAGIYGTNFTPGFFEPGSDSPLGFYLFVSAMVITALGFVYY